MRSRLSTALSFVLLMAFTTALAQVEVVYWTHEDPNRTALEEELIERFHAENPDIAITRVTHPSNALAQLVLTAFAANRGPDVFNLEIFNEYPYIVNQRVAPVDPVAAGFGSYDAFYDAYLDGMLDPVTVDGLPYGIPLELTNWAIFLNMNVFRDVGLDPLTDYPKTWEEMMEVADRLTVRDGEIITRRGFDFRYPYYLNFMVPMAQQLGGQLIGDDGESAIVGDEAWLRVLEYFRAWGPHGRNLGSPTYANARALFNFDNDDIGMMESGQYQIARIANDNPGFLPGEGWMVIPFPVWEDAVDDAAGAYYGHYWMVNAQSDDAKQEAAWAFVGYMAQFAEDFFERAGLLQASQAVLDSDTFKDHPYSDVFMADLARAPAIYYGDASPQIRQALQDAVEAVMLQNREPAEVLVALRESVERALRGEY
jgi:multiple sugar transport system substrate-binding protein